MGINRTLVGQAIAQHLKKWLNVLQKSKVRVAMKAVVQNEKILLIIKSVNERTFQSQLSLPGLPVQVYLFQYQEFERKDFLMKRHPPIRM